MHPMFGQEGGVLRDKCDMIIFLIFGVGCCFFGFWVGSVEEVRCSKIEHTLECPDVSATCEELSGYKLKVREPGIYEVCKLVTTYAKEKQHDKESYD